MDRESKDSAIPLASVHRVAVLALPGVVPLDLAIPLQAFGPWPTILHDAIGFVPPYRVDLVGADDMSVGDWLRAAATASVEQIAAADTVVVPGVMDPTLPVPVDVVDAVREAGRRGARMLSICTGAFVLAEAGLLDGRRATTHWQWAAELRARHPRVEVAERELFVEEGDVITSAGVLAGADLCLHVVRRDLGQHVANALARFLVSPPQREGGQAQYTTEPPVRQEELARVTDWILEHLGESLSVERIAEHAHLSVRTLSRRFRATLGVPVMEWVIRQRVARARELLETTDRSVTEIAFACGFGSPESLRVHFAEHTLTSPSRYRATFA